MHSIGVIKSPFTDLVEMPIQPKGAANTEGEVVVENRYQEGLQDIEGFSHIYLIYSFHRAKRVEMKVIPFMDSAPRGVFATRSPLRPNHIGLSLVELIGREGNVLRIRGVDILNDTPLLDIKPYIAQFDHVENSRSGWLTASQKEISQKRSDKRFL